MDSPPRARRTLSIVDSLTVERPCHEDPAGMEPRRCGAYCKACKKKVWDTEQMSRNQVRLLLALTRGSCCVRIVTDSAGNNCFKDSTLFSRWKAFIRQDMPMMVGALIGIVVGVRAQPVAAQSAGAEKTVTRPETTMVTSECHEWSGPTCGQPEPISKQPFPTLVRQPYSSPGYQYSGSTGSSPGGRTVRYGDTRVDPGPLSRSWAITAAILLMVVSAVFMVISLPGAIISSDRKAVVAAEFWGFIAVLAWVALSLMIHFGRVTLF